MINVPGERLPNMSPPSLALLALATVQICVVLLIRRPVRQWLDRPRPGMGVVAINTVILTVFLWHMSAAVLTVGSLHAIDMLPTPEAGSAVWFVWRVPWLLMLTATLAILVALFGPIEIRRSHRSRRRPRWPATARGPVAVRPWLRPLLAVVALAAIALALLDNSLVPRTEPATFGIPTLALVTYVTGATIQRLLRTTPPASPEHPRLLR
ncbi:hypothetical protein [Microlunatus parietis]|uniref:Small-conductance mechanosensitive channel n=1 Tax=Microlunatus parietis TaxID=682979 RepID=A0A7Y9I883_9ACTN|nr:hypothetical protein [Microlunatus parietis]NYE72129.1 small-conductance mechanosensitive channel [Microlunatus parietis]